MCFCLCYFILLIGIRDERFSVLLLAGTNIGAHAVRWAEYIGLTT